MACRRANQYRGYIGVCAPRPSRPSVSQSQYTIGHQPHLPKSLVAVVVSVSSIPSAQRRGQRFHLSDRLEYARASSRRLPASLHSATSRNVAQGRKRIPKGTGII